ncbi:MAG TPA: LURP-one-related family protein [Candidatus Sumerlaeota bacterium]|nr:LURP-one-related family protein [Candidatus Sumerlaeota bacterium]HPS03421.1 LURP-one-related family protein [Candidatus Sumerlaeota bacterium]
MRYLMKQKLFSLGDDFYIQDESGQNAFFVDGKVFALGDQLSFQDLAGNELAFIRQKLLAWGPTYEIYRDGTLYATVQKDLFSFLHCCFSVDVPGPDDLEAEGDFLNHEYTFTRQGFPIATVSKQWFSWADTYGVEIARGEDEVLLLACSVVIDMACHDEKNR